MDDATNVMVTGANGLVGAAVCRALAERGAHVRALVRREGAAPSVPGVEEWVGDFLDPEVAASAVAGVAAVVSTVHPLGGSGEEQQEVAVSGTPALALAARDAGVGTFVHVSTAAVYDRSPGVGDVDEDGSLVGDDAGVYAVTKRDADAALAEVEGITRVLVRPPAILGAGESSVWNSVNPASIREKDEARRTNPEKTFAWVHVDDLADLLADLATGRIAAGDDPASGPVSGGCTPVNAAADRATQRDYLGTVCEALGIEPEWTDEPAWTGRLVADRARAWGWTPAVSLDDALAELRDGLR